MSGVIEFILSCFGVFGRLLLSLDLGPCSRPDIARIRTVVWDGSHSVSGGHGS